MKGGHPLPYSGLPVERVRGVDLVTSAHAQGQPAAAQQVPPGAREVPSRAIPVPDTVSPRMQAVIARPFDPGFNLVPQTTAECKARVEKVISVDYRMPPDFPFPAALDDAVAVYRTILQTTAAKNVGIFGVSAGGSLTITSRSTATCRVFRPLS